MGKEDFIQGYCNREEARSQSEPNSAEAEGGRVFKGCSEREL